jgi:hypothetical protein
MSAFSKLLTGFSSLMLLGVIAAVPACDSDGDGEGGAAGEGGEAGEAGAGGKSGAAGSSGAGGKAGASGSAGKGGSGGDAGDTGVAGAAEQGGAGGEPASSGGSAGSGTGEGGNGGSGEPQIATAKFCNNVGVEGGDVEFTIRIGTGDTRLTLTALTGTCAPLEGACPELATGNDVPFEILDHEDDVYFEGTFEVAAGDQLVIFAEYDEEEEEPSADLAELGDDECSELDFDDFYSEE